MSNHCAYKLLSEIEGYVKYMEYPDCGGEFFFEKWELDLFIEALKTYLGIEEEE